MEINDYKKRLKELGLSEKLIEMPAVTKELLELAIGSQMSLEVFDSYVKVESPEKCSILQNQITLQNDGTAEIEYYDYGKLIGKAKTDVYGFEEVHDETLGHLERRYFKRNNGFIDVDRYDLYGEKVSRSFFDVGKAQINRPGTHTPEDEFGRQCEFNEDNLWELFDIFERKTIAIYPHLKEYFEALRKQVKVRVDAEKLPERKKETQKKEERNLFNECKTLSKDLADIDRDLKIQLDFLEAVKKHPIGRILFKKQLIKYANQIKNYAESKEKVKEDECQDKRKKEEEKEQDTEKRLEELRQRRVNLINAKKRSRVMREIAFNSVGEILKDSKAKVLTILPIYIKYTDQTREYYKDVLMRDKSSKKDELERE